MSISKVATFKPLISETINRWDNFPGIGIRREGGVDKNVPLYGRILGMEMTRDITSFLRLKIPPID